MFKLLPHTADIRLWAMAASPEELFRSALQGMAHLQKQNFCKQEGLFFDRKTIQIKAIDLSSLLIDFLSEVLTYSHIHRVVYCEVRFQKLSDIELKATVKGNKVTDFDKDIKAVTYHEAEIRENKKKQLETVIIFDI